MRGELREERVGGRCADIYMCAGDDLIGVSRTSANAIPHLGIRMLATTMSLPEIRLV